MVRRIAFVAALGACGDPGIVLAPVIELPPAGSEADPLTSIEEVELSVARAGDPDPLVSATFTPGDELVLDGVPLGDDLVVHLSGRAANVEIAYGRTCRFDLAAEGESPEPHLMFSRTVHWAPAPGPATARTGGDTWRTADQGVAVALGASAEGTVTSIEYFDPFTGAWSVAATVSARTLGVVAAFGDGRGVLLGGRDGDGNPHGQIEVVDPFSPETGRVTTIGDLRLGLVGAAAETLETGDVVVMGGRDILDEPVGTVWVIDQFEFDPVPPLESAAVMMPRSGHTLTRLSDTVGAPVLVIGGRDAAGVPIGIAQLYRPLPDDFSPFTADLAIDRYDHAAIRLPDGSVLVIGGRDLNGIPVRQMELFTLDGGFQLITTELPADAGLIGASVTALPDGRILLAGGTAEGDVPTTAAYVIRLDSVDGTVDVARTDDLDVARSGHAAGLLCDGTVLVVGGTGSATAERYQPPSFGRR